MAEKVHAPRAAQAVAQWAGPRWLWFGVLGGTIAWGVHLMTAWLSDELACARGDAHVFGVPLRTVSILLTVVPLVIAIASLVVAWRATVVLREAQADPPAGVPPRRIHRARFMAEVGAWLDAFAVLMIVFGGVAVATFPPCVR